MLAHLLYTSGNLNPMKHISLNLKPQTFRGFHLPKKKTLFKTLDIFFYALFLIVLILQFIRQ